MSKSINDDTKRKSFFSEKVVENREIILSQKDSKVFFEAITNYAKPNKKLIKAVEEYNSLLAK